MVTVVHRAQFMFPIIEIVDFMLHILLRLFTSCRLILESQVYHDFSLYFPVPVGLLGHLKCEFCSTTEVKSFSKTQLRRAVKQKSVACAECVEKRTNTLAERAYFSCSVVLQCYGVRPLHVSRRQSGEGDFFRRV